MAFNVDVELLIDEYKNMNKKIYYGIVFLIVTLTSCDPKFFHDFYIENCCEESIEITIFYYERYAYPASGKPLITNFVVEPSVCKLIGTESTIGAFDDIRYYFDSIEVKNGERKSNIDYLDYSRWSSKKKSKYYTDSFLLVFPEDFEEK